MATTGCLTERRFSSHRVRLGGTFVVLAVTDREAGARGISAFIVEKGTPGFSHGPKLHKLGMNSSDTSELYFEDCRIPAENLLGKLGHGFIDTMKILDAGRIGIGAIACGIIRGSMEESLKYASERKQFGKPIGEFQAIRWKVVDMMVAYEAARNMISEGCLAERSGQTLHH